VQADTAQSLLCCTGLLDLQEPIPHPTDEVKPDVPASCVLAVATVDGVLRLYRLANFARDTGLACTPAQVPAALPVHVTSVLQAAVKQDQLEEVRHPPSSSCSPLLRAALVSLAGGLTDIPEHFNIPG